MVETQVSDVVKLLDLSEKRSKMKIFKTTFYKQKLLILC